MPEVLQFPDFGEDEALRAEFTLAEIVVAAPMAAAAVDVWGVMSDLSLDGGWHPAGVSPVRGMHGAWRTQIGWGWLGVELTTLTSVPAPMVLRLEHRGVVRLLGIRVKSSEAIEFRSVSRVGSRSLVSVVAFYKNLRFPRTVLHWVARRVAQAFGVFRRAVARLDAMAARSNEPHRRVRAGELSARSVSMPIEALEEAHRIFDEYDPVNPGRR